MIGCIIFARPNSQRLPDKHNRLIGQKRLLQYVIDSARKFSDVTILATTHGNTKHYENYYISAYEAPDVDDNNIVGRLKAMNDIFTKCEFVVTICGDCPLIDVELVKLMIETLRNSDADYVKVPGNHSHEGIEVIRQSSINMLTDDEHLSRSLNNLKYVETIPVYTSRFRASVDNHADLAFLRECNHILTTTGRKFTHQEVSDLVKTFPLVLRINSHINQKMIDFQDDKPNVAIITEGNENVGMGHVARAIGLAQEFNECQHKHVEIYINDNDNVRKMLNRYGYEENLDFFVGYPVIKNISDWIIIYDKKDECTLDYHNIYMENPIFAVNKRLNYIMYEIDSDYLVSFGMGDYSKYAKNVVDKLKNGHIISVTGIDNFENYLYGADTVVTMWSQTAREAIFLEKTVHCYTATELDAELCKHLNKHEIVKWMGDIRQLE